VQVAFLGTSEYAASVLRRLGESPHAVTLVVTPPDRPRGRGRRLSSPPAAAAARELGLDLLQTESVNDPEALDRILDAKPDGVVVCAFGQLIRDPLLSAFELLNVHPSLLPRWRGAAPIERAIMAGDPETGVTIMGVTAGLDSGPIALQERVEIGSRDDFGSLAARLADLGGELAVRALDLQAAGELTFTDQDDSRATYAEKITPPERRLDPARPAVELERVVRALTPHVGAFLELDGGTRLGIREAFAEDGEGPVGELQADGGTLRLGCSSGWLRLALLQPPGKRPMPADAYLRGHPVPRLAA
jgi:methionyl-tRNA formyltransferase